MTDPERDAFRAGYARGIAAAGAAHAELVDTVGGMVDSWSPRALVTIEDKHVMELEAVLLGVDADMCRLRDDGAARHLDSGR